MGKTTIIQHTATGKVAFKAEMPGHLSTKEIRKECRKWKVSTKGLTIKYSNYVHF